MIIGGMHLIDDDVGSPFVELAAVEARKSLCLARRCGVVIVKDGVVIGAGHNGPPKDDLSIRHCDSSMPDSCVHAEWRAIMDGLRQHPEAIVGSTLYFTAVDAEGKILKSGKPYCTVCSRLALDVGIAEFVLWHQEGITAYRTDEYNRISYENAMEKAKARF